MIPVIGIDPSLTSCGLSNGKQHELVKTVPVEETTWQNNLRRVDEIIQCIEQFIGGKQSVDIWLEGPMLNGKHSSHLYDIGWLYSEIYRRFYVTGRAVIHEVQPTVLKKFITGNGQSKKDHKPDEKRPCVVCAARDVWGITFDKDPGKDKLHAYFLVKYGRAAQCGDITHAVAKRRSSKKRKKSTPTNAKSKRSMQVRVR